MRSAKCCREVLMVVRGWPDWGAAVAATAISEPAITRSAPTTVFSELGAAFRELEMVFRELGAVFRELETVFRKPVITDGW